MSKTFRNYVQIDLDSIRNNCKLIRKLLQPKCHLLTVLKANAYGYGIQECAMACQDDTDMFAVATLEEALKIRQKSITTPILIFGPIDLTEMNIICQESLTITISSLDYAQAVQNACRQIGRNVLCHLKIDSGLNRTGFTCRIEDIEDCVNQVSQVFDMHELQIKGTYTHFACAASEDPNDQEFTRKQFETFIEFCRIMKMRGYNLGVRHCCSSGAILRHPEMHLDMVRSGMLVLGQSISDDSFQHLGLNVALTWRARIIQIRQVPAGESISYNRLFKTEKAMRLAIIAAGYADGYKQNYSNKTRVLVHGQFAPVVGSICMDYFMADISHIKGVEVGDYAVLLGTDGDNSVSPMELGTLNGTAPGEVTCAISARVPRLYYPNIHINKNKQLVNDADQQTL